MRRRRRRRGRWLTQSGGGVSGGQEKVSVSVSTRVRMGPAYAQPQLSTY